MVRKVIPSANKTIIVTQHSLLSKYDGTSLVQTIKGMSFVQISKQYLLTHTIPSCRSPFRLLLQQYALGVYQGTKFENRASFESNTVTSCVSASDQIIRNARVNVEGKVKLSGRAD